MSLQTIIDEFLANVRSQLSVWVDQRNATAKATYDGQLHDYLRNVEQNGSDKGLVKPGQQPLYSANVAKLLDDIAFGKSVYDLADYIVQTGVYPEKVVIPIKSEWGGVANPVGVFMEKDANTGLDYYTVTSGAVVVPGKTFTDDRGTFVSVRYGIFGVRWMKTS